MREPVFTTETMKSVLDDANAYWEKEKDLEARLSGLQEAVEWWEKMHGDPYKAPEQVAEADTALSTALEASRAGE